MSAVGSSTSSTSDYVKSLASGTSSSSDSSSSTTSNSSLNLKPQDFIKMMITQLQQQDPTQPASNDQLLAQMSQISQLQSNTDLTTTMKSLVQQSQVGSAATLIGKSVTGLDSTSNPVSGTVKSVSVTTDGANLQLDNGTSLALSNVISITNPTTTSGTSTPTGN